MITKFQIFEDLKEGLITTTPSKQTIKIFRRKFPDYYFGYRESGEYGEIEITPGRKEYISGDIQDINRLCKQLGWFISYGYEKIDDNNRGKNHQHKFDNNFFDRKYEEIIIKQKFDQKDIIGKPSIMYHVTPVKNIEKIFRIGLIPKHKDKLVSHPDIVYLTDELELAWGLKKQFERIEKSECEILKVLTKGLDIKLYSDVDSRVNGFYTLDNIPPQFISILPQEEYRKHWKF